MSIDSCEISNGGNLVSKSMENNSVGSNDSHSDQGLKRVHNNCSVAGNVKDVKVSGDALSRALMDPRSQPEGLANYDEWTIDLRKLKMGKAFAEGALGKVYKGTYKGEDVAIKLLQKPDNDPERALLMERLFQEEVIMLATLKHRNIVPFIGACRKPMVWCIVTEYAKGGSVRQILAKRQKSQNNSVQLKLAVKQALGVARGMEYVHGLNLIHCGLNSNNLIIASDQSIKIADFGVARIEVQTEGMTPETGTYRWMAPEMIMQGPYSEKVDVYSFRIVLWELATGRLPFQNMTATQAAFGVVNRRVRPDTPHIFCAPGVFSQITSLCWDGNPDARPTFSQVVKMLEDTEIEIMATVKKARSRCCMSRPMCRD